MASPCEVLVESEFETQAHELCTLAQQEAMRIEQKFSRYRDDNIVYRINDSRGLPLQVDEETARLLTGAPPVRSPQPITLAIDKVKIRALPHFQRAAVVVIKTHFERLEGLTRSLTVCWVTGDALGIDLEHGNANDYMNDLKQNI